MGEYAWVTLATNDSYCLGALVLAHSLKRVGTKHDLVVLITPGVTYTMREKLSTVFSVVQEVDVLDSQDEANLALLARPELGITFTKLHCWRLTQYKKCVFVDADALVIRNCDELFERKELSAAPDVGWPDCFNSGVFVFHPSQETFASLIEFAAIKGSFDGGDQGLLNQYFNDWSHKDISKHLPFIYNMCSTATYSYLPAYKQYGSDVRIIHFIGSTKPWLQYFDTHTGEVHPSSESSHLQPLLQLWWNIFCEMVHPQLSPIMNGIAGALAKITLGAVRSPEEKAFEEHMRKQSWEQGKIDYMGRDSFNNIWTKICTTVSNVIDHEAILSQEKITIKNNQPDADATTVNTAVQVLETEREEPILQEHHDALTEARLNNRINEERTQKNAPLCETKTPTAEDLSKSDSIKPLDAAYETVQIHPDEIDQSSEIVPASSCSLSKYCVAESTVNAQKMKMDALGIALQIENNESIHQSAAIPLSCPSKNMQESITSSSIQQIKIKSEESSNIIEESQNTQNAASSTVPIQVAESVLEADIKESVSEDMRPVTEEAISSMSAPIQESISAIVETPLESPAPAHAQSIEALLPPQPNGTGKLDFNDYTNKNSKLSRMTSQTLTVPQESLTIAELLCSTSAEHPKLESKQESKTSSVETKEKDDDVKQSSTSEIILDNSQSIEQASKFENLSAQTCTDSDQLCQPAQLVAPSKETLIKEIESKIDMSDTTAIKTVSEDNLGKLDETKQKKSTLIAQFEIPGTPTVTEATPPTSPPLDIAMNLDEENRTKKTLKKLTKKSLDEKAESNETEENKKAKKITKKGTSSTLKKSKELKETLEKGADNNTTEKVKKMVKVKKTMKSSQNLETDTSIPDTPPPTTSETPVPPKRKAKSTIAKVPIDKPDAEA